MKTSKLTKFKLTEKINITGYRLLIIGIFCSAFFLSLEAIAIEGFLFSPAEKSYSIVDTSQEDCYDDANEIFCPEMTEAFFGQDSQYEGLQPDYLDNGDGTVTDINTGLMWQQDPGDKMSYSEAVSEAALFNLAGYDDWRLPTIKELYSLIQFSGLDPSGIDGSDTSGLIPFINTDYFNFEYGDPDSGERIIDSQWATSTEYVSTTMGGNRAMFGVNFADGRIKGYPAENKDYFVIYVRGNLLYGSNDFTDNSDGTISDNATGLMWMQHDSGYFGAGNDGDGALTWEKALEWAENLEYAGYDDWRLPNAKELQSIVDYTRSPATTSSPAIDPVFSTSTIIDEGGDINYPFFWTSTTHANTRNGMAAVYIAFGEALGWMQNPLGGYTLMDVHGAGAQRSDPKIGDPVNYPYGHGPQGDVIRIYNYVRCVRSMDSGSAGDTDSDGDGVPDNTDGCPYDANKVSPGICDCGTIDIDTDLDGAADCIDGCPADPDKDEPGACGCGLADTDTDGNGIPDCLESDINLTIRPDTIIVGSRSTIEIDITDQVGKRLKNVSLNLSGCGIEKEIIAKRARIRLRRMIPTEPGVIIVTASKDGYMDFIGSIIVTR